MEFNWSLLIAAIALLVSVSSPLLTAIINGRYQANMKQTEIRTEQRMKAIRNYLQKAGEHSYGTTYGKSHEYLAARSEIYLFVDQKYWGDLDAFDAAVGNSDEANRILTKIAKELSKTYFD